jgi:hypothetical protein
VVKFISAILFVALISTHASSAIAQDSSWRIIPVSAEPQKREDCSFVETDGKFYLIDGRGILSVEVFDPAANTWEKRKKTPFEMHHFQGISSNR